MGPTLDTVIIGAGQAGRTTSYWLTQFGVEHQLLERRDSLGGAFQDRWDSFYMNTPNLALDLPGMPYDGDDRDSFISRIAVVNLFRRYAELIAAQVHTGVDVTRLPGSDGGIRIHLGGLGRSRMHLHCHFELIDHGTATVIEDFRRRLAAVESAFSRPPGSNAVPEAR